MSCPKTAVEVLPLGKTTDPRLGGQASGKAQCVFKDFSILFEN